MRLIAVHPGASYSTADVFDGLVGALRARGHELLPYQLDMRIARSASWLLYNWRQAKRAAPDLARPTTADIVYQAGLEAIHRALRADCEWVLVVSGMFLHPDILVMLRRAGRRIALVFTESPYDDADQAKVAPLADICWTNERASVPVLRRANPNAHYLPHAYDPTRHRPSTDADESAVPAHDVVFVGTLFAERQELLSAVDWSGIDLGIYGQQPYLGSRARLRAHIAGGITDNATTAALYRKAKIGLNLYRTSMGFGRLAPRVIGAESLNPRALELAAAGCFTVSDDRAEVREVFGTLVPTFRDARELEETVRAWLSDDAGRERVSMRLPTAIAGHTFAARAAQIEAALDALGAGRAVA